MDSISGMSYYLNKKLAAIKHVVDDIFLSFSNTYSTCMYQRHGACNILQLQQCKTLNFINPELWPPTAYNCIAVDYKI